VADGYAGALLVKKGSILATMKPQAYILEKAHDYVMQVYTGANAAFDLYEDDAFTYDYQKGGYATTRFVWDEQEGTLTVYKREGSFDGREDNGHDFINNAIPKIPRMQPVRDMQVRIYGKTPKEICLNGEQVDFMQGEGYAEFTVKADLHEASDLTYKIHY
jgi:alpha-D-xyloside xylohydrolase